VQRNIDDIFHKKNILFIFPHPDDESYSSSILIKRLIEKKERVFLLFISNGVPIKKKYQAPISLIYSYDEYLSTRKNELNSAMEYLGLDKKNLICFNYFSQTILNKIPEVISLVKEVIFKKNINVIFCPPYEGSHPDHDVLSFIVSKISKKLNNIKVFEYTGYYLKDKKINSGNFLKKSKFNNFLINLTLKEILFKKNIIKMYKSQNDILKKIKFNSKELFREQIVSSYKEMPTFDFFYSSWLKSIKPIDVVKKFKNFV